MELKLAIEAVLKTYADGSNRTFMELKYRYYTKKSSRKVVLIVPLWN